MRIVSLKAGKWELKSMRKRRNGTQIHISKKFETWVFGRLVEFIGAMLKPREDSNKKQKQKMIRKLRSSKMK